MRRLTYYMGFVVAAFLSCLSLSAFAEPISNAYSACRIAFSDSEPQGTAMQRLELTLAMWRTGSDTGSIAVKSNLIALSNHFGMTGAVPSATPDWPGAISA